MKIEHSKSVVNSFISTLADAVGSQNSLVIHMSGFTALNLDAGQAKVNGNRWLDSVPLETQYNFIVADLPLGMVREKFKIGGKEISLRKNWCELTKALRLLDDNGMCLALIEPSVFGIAEGLKYEKALGLEGYHLNGIFNAPENLFEMTSIRPVLVAISKFQTEDVFVAELEDENQAAKLAHAFRLRSAGNSLSDGQLFSHGAFRNFYSLEIEQQLSRLETQYKEYRSEPLGAITKEINIVRIGQEHEVKENAIYIRRVGYRSVTYDINQINCSHHHVFQVVLSEMANNEYVSAFFQSDLGTLVLKSICRGQVISSISKLDLRGVKIALPPIDEQDEIALTYCRLSSLSQAIRDFQTDLALNPRSSVAIKDQLENMLEQIGELTDSDKVMSLSRSGESKTVEFKESFSLDVRKGTKENYIELSALKTLVAFLNTEGGTLLVGVSDKGELLGINKEVDKLYKNNDKFLLHLKNQIKQRIGEQYYPFINQRIVSVSGSYILMIECSKSSNPCYLDSKDFFVRTNPATDKLEGPKLVGYVQSHFN